MAGVAVTLLAGCATPAASPPSESPDVDAIELSDAGELAPAGASLVYRRMGVVGHPVWDPRSTLTPDGMRKFLIEPPPVGAPPSVDEGE